MQTFAWADRTERARSKHNTEHRPSTRFSADQLTNNKTMKSNFGLGAKKN